LYLAKNGVVIATDKKVSSTLVDLEEYQKIQLISPTTGIIIRNITLCSA
jgi:20S proteasome alpha/beta subunit